LGKETRKVTLQNNRKLRSKSKENTDLKINLKYTT
jgi:hypothetical protein